MADDEGVWEHHKHGTGWIRCHSDDAIEAAFQMGRENISLTLASTGDFVAISFKTMTLQPRGGALEFLRRRSMKEFAEIVYEWEDVYSGNIVGSLWTPYIVDDCELLRIAEDVGRSKVVIYIGYSNNPYEINLSTHTQVSQQGFRRNIRKRMNNAAAPPAASVITAADYWDTGAANYRPPRYNCTVEDVVREAVEVCPRTFTGADICPVCMDGFGTHCEDAKAYRMKNCSGHFFHKPCIRMQLHSRGRCAVCSTAYIIQIGDQPESGTMAVYYDPPSGGCSLAGFPSTVGTIVIHYDFPNGVQGPRHPHPGVRYSGTSRVAYLPDTPEGRQILRLLEKCFERRLTFTVGRSLTTGLDNCIVWNGVHHKTSRSGGPQRYGWPDETFFFRVKEELKSKGIDSATIDL